MIGRTDSDYVDNLAEIAAELAVRVRDDDPEANGRWLAAMLPDPQDWFNLAFILAAAVPDDRSWRALTAWTVQGEPQRRLQPHGTTAAAARHRYRREPVCDPCRDAVRERDRERKRMARTASKPMAVAA